jgi:hypothetical protein
MSNPLVSADIKSYADAQLRTNAKFSWMRLGLANEVAEAIAEGAQGM